MRDTIIDKIVSMMIFVPTNHFFICITVSEYEYDFWKLFIFDGTCIYVCQ